MKPKSTILGTVLVLLFSVAAHAGTIISKTPVSGNDLLPDSSGPVFTIWKGFAILDYWQTCTTPIPLYTWQTYSLVYSSKTGYKLKEGNWTSSQDWHAVLVHEGLAQ